VKSEGFRDLEVYERSAALADAVRAEVHGWNRLDKWTAGVQLIRAADSVGANIADATGRWSHPDQVRFLFMARGSAHELEHWIARAASRQLRCPAGADEEARRISRMLNGLIKALKNGRLNRL
jgi:four helix bundle protein